MSANDCTCGCGHGVGHGHHEPTCGIDRINAETVAGLQAHARKVESDRARLVRALAAATKEVRAWDLASDAFGDGLRDLVPRPFGPNRKASDRCESGKRDYCSCDLCF